MGLEDRLDPSRFGIFSDSEALGAIDDMEVSQTPDAYVKSRPCEICSRRKECHIPWAEVYCLAYSVMPDRIGQTIGRPDLFQTRWLYNRQFQCFHPEYRCNCHQNAIVIFDITPTEAERVLKQASKNGVVSEGQRRLIHAIAPIVAKVVTNQNSRAPLNIPI